MKTLYALFVGIDDYQNINGLESAVRDANRLHDFFTTFVEKPKFKPLLLTNNEATKTEIVTAFQNQFFPERGEDDVMLFYFSGHGAQEMADEVFHKSELDKKLESLACYDADLENATGFLADKELRWLIYQAKQKNPKTHFVMISDCCHAGDNTRGTARKELPIARKRYTDDAKMRDWSEFIFSDTISKELVANQPLDEVLPQGEHVSIAACKSTESAWEIFEGGVFTSGLLKFLDESSGNISYYDLKTHVKNFVETQYEQSPQIYSSDENGLLVFEKFLGGSIKDKPAKAHVYYNHYESQWEMNMGAIYGVSKTWGEAGAAQRIIIPDGEEEKNAVITEVFPGKSVIAFEPYSGTNPSEQYRALVPSLMSRQLRIQLRGEEKGIKVLKETLSPKAVEGASIYWTDESPDYTILAKANEYLITQPCTDSPLTKQEVGYTKESCNALLDHLKSIGKWTFVKCLQNSDSQLGKDLITTEITQDEVPLEIIDDVISLNVDPQSLKTSIKIKLTHQGESPIHVGMVYLSSLFGLSPNLLQGQVKELKQGDTLWARGGSAIKLGLEPYIQQMGWEQEVFYVQLIYSMEPFEIALFAQKDLEVPLKRGGTTRGMDLDSGPDWQTRLLEFRLKAPTPSVP